MFKIVLLSCFLSVSAFAQQVHKPMLGDMQPGRSVVDPPSKPHPDSAKFNAAFRELYALVKTPPGVKERTNAQWQRMWRMFKARGLDSIIAYDSIMHVLDTNMDRKILYNEYRDQFTAEELQAVVDFMKTPAGKRYMEVEPRLLAARTGAVDQYVRSTITAVTQPMLMVKGLPQPGMLPPQAAPPMVPKQQTKKKAGE
jgi:hypothetical protein